MEDHRNDRGDRKSHTGKQPVPGDWRAAYRELKQEQHELMVQMGRQSERLEHAETHIRLLDRSERSTVPPEPPVPKGIKSIVPRVRKNGAAIGWATVVTTVVVSLDHVIQALITAAQHH